MNAIVFVVQKQARMARPKSSDPKSVTIQIRVTPTQKEQAEASAKEMGALNASDLLRSLMRQNNIIA